jgi:outer membrane protein assembly factor BamB
MIGIYGVVIACAIQLCDYCTKLAISTMAKTIVSFRRRSSMKRQGQVSASIAVLLWATTLASADWPAFRGAQGIGVSPERGLPLKWGPQENVVWKTKLPGPGASSPITWGDRVFLTCYTGYGDGKNKTATLADLRRHLVCLDRKDGKILWQKDAAAKLPESEYAGQIQQHGYATSTPVTDGERIYAFFGRSGVFAHDFSGKELWQVEVGKMLNGWGSAASPVLYKNLLLVNATVESGALVALDKATGKQVWKRKIQDDSWATPLLMTLPSGKQEIVLSGKGTLYGIDPENGDALWECDTNNFGNAGSMPVVKGDVVYHMSSDFNGRTVMAVRAGGRGDVTKTHIVWKQDKIGASYCSLVLAGEHLYYANGQFCCLRADTGQIVFQERLAGLGAEYSSPVAADGKLYLFTRTGRGHVLAASGKFEPLANNDLGDPSGFSASPAIDRGQILIRSNEYLYCLGQKK